jgi:hypothetical protein
MNNFGLYSEFFEIRRGLISYGMQAIGNLFALMHFMRQSVPAVEPKTLPAMRRGALEDAGRINGRATRQERNKRAAIRGRDLGGL